jgi:hypothetical protein
MQDRGLGRIDDNITMLEENITIFEENITIQEIEKIQNQLQIDFSAVLSIEPIWILFFILISLLVFYKYSQYHRNNLYRREAINQWNQILAKDDFTLKAHHLLELMHSVAEDYYQESEIPEVDNEKWWEFIQYNSKVVIDDKVLEIWQTLHHKPETKITGRDMMLIAHAVRSWIKTHK